MSKPSPYGIRVHLSFETYQRLFALHIKRFGRVRGHLEEIMETALREYLDRQEAAVAP